MNRRGILSLVLVASALAVADAGCGSSDPWATSRATAFNFGPFAGYSQVGPVVRQVSATLTVPSVSPQANGPSASTWVGAEGVGPDLNEPFIQVGVLEIAGEHAPSGSLPPAYAAFWSDTALGYHPIPLFSVHARDRVLASLRRANGHWIISIVDGPKHRRTITADEGGAEFRQALWFQEHPTVGHSFLPYPRVSGLRISDLLVNGAAPRGLNPEWMLAGKKVYEPTPVNHDAFALLPAQLTVPAETVHELLKLTRPYSVSANPETRLAAATAKTPRANLVTWASRVTAEIASFQRALRHRHWQNTDQNNVNALLGALQRQLTLTRQTARIASPQFTGWQSQWKASSAASTIAGPKRGSE